jgi:dihydroxy-acid dehydratase
MPAPLHRYRSREWLDTPEMYGWTRRAALQSLGIAPEQFEGRPIVGICNTWSELTHCNAHLRTLAEAVKRGVWQAGGVPLEFPAMSLGEFNMRPTTMLFRNLLSMEVEESIRANPLDGVVLLTGCDKTTPGCLMGAASADVPAILLTGGPQLSAHWRGETLGSCTDCRRYETELRAGRDVAGRRLDLCVPPEEIARRLAEHRPSSDPPSRGYRRLYAEHVLQADRGCDFDFLTDGHEMKRPS